MKFHFHELAQAEFESAVEYYEHCRRGLGMEFAQEVHATIARIRKYPEAWTPLSKSTRRSLVHRFPFGVIYRMTRDSLHIVAVADLRRPPDYWLQRH